MKNDLIGEFLQSRIDAQDFPSAVYLVAEKGKIVLWDALGFAVVEPERIAAEVATIYDVASLTKVLITTLLCAKLIENGAINLSDKVSGCFDEFNAADKREITIQNLLTHTSGLPAWKPFYLLAKSSATEDLLPIIAAAPLENTVDSKVVYSDLNFLTLGFLLEKIHGKPLDEIARTEIFEPLKLQNTFYNPPQSMLKQIAASENGNGCEKQMCADSGFDTAKYRWREYQIRGEVHDGNCCFMNGVAGHAGLFSNVREVFAVAQQFLASQTRLLKPETCRLFRTNLTEMLNEARSIGFQLAATGNSTASDALAKDSFGHLGFTGTSLWIAPSSERIFILLTNRTHAHDLPFANINDVRRRFHELAADDPAGIR